MAFLTANDLGRVVHWLEVGPFSNGVRESVLPIAEAVERLLGNPSRFLLPVIGEYRRDKDRSRRLDIVLATLGSTAGPAQLTVHCYFDQAAIHREQLEASASSGAVVVVAPLRSDLHSWTDTHPHLRGRLVNPVMTYGENGVLPTEAVYRQLARELTLFSSTGAEATLPYNFVRDFPEKPSVKRRFLVHRPSVRGLLSIVERGTGAHVWCSVRRSGKTTSGFELSATTGSAIVVTQTCDSTGARDGDDTFYQECLRVIEAQKQIPQTFFEDAVRKSAPGPSGDSKIVFVLDEYETLFGQLRISEGNEALRYRVVQPLLNQMVRFSRDHLLVFLGMRPDAHFVLMDQNQLSPYVVQDQFPLFAHHPGAETSEFRDLLQKACGTSVAIETGFSDALHVETGGHPLLTVSVMFQVFEWLIDTRRPARGLTLTAADYRDFAANERFGLSESILRGSSSYNLMRHAVRSGLADTARRGDPWHYAVYVVLREIARSSPESLAVTRDEVVHMIHRLGLRSRGGSDPDELLRTAGHANVFNLDGPLVRPRIPLLARLAASVTPPTEA